MKQHRRASALGDLARFRGGGVPMLLADENRRGWQ